MSDVALSIIIIIIIIIIINYYYYYRIYNKILNHDWFSTHLFVT